MNDSLRTDVFVRYAPETIATACIYLSARKLKVILFQIYGTIVDDWLKQFYAKFDALLLLI